MCVPGMDGVCSFSLEVNNSARNFANDDDEIKKQNRNSVVTNFREFCLFHFANRGFANCICTVDSVNRFEMKSTRVTNPIPEINNE